MKLYARPSERDEWDNMRDLYAIVVTIEHLEKAYIRDAISPSEYTPACAKLLAQYKTAINLYTDGGIDGFLQEYRVSCSAALNRIRIGVPATIEHATSADHSSSSSGNSAQFVAEAVQLFITLMDTLKLNLTAVDQVHPLLSDLMQALNKVPSLPADYAGKQKIKNWLVTLNKMRASEEMSEEQSRQLMFDLETSHNEFYRSLSSQK